MLLQSAWTLLSPPQQSGLPQQTAPRLLELKEDSPTGDSKVWCLCVSKPLSGFCFLCAIPSFVLHQVAPKPLSLPTNPSSELHAHFQANYMPFCFKEQHPPGRSSPGDLCLRATVPQTPSPPTSPCGGASPLPFRSHRWPQPHLSCPTSAGGTSSPHLSPCTRVRRVQMIFRICHHLFSCDSQPT